MCIEAWDRGALERLTRYCARPPFAAGRLAPIDEKTVAYELRKPTQDGRSCLFMDPLELLARLASLIARIY